MAGALLSALQFVVPSLISTVIDSVETIIQRNKEEEMKNSQERDAKLVQLLKKLKKNVKKMDVVSFVEEYEALVNEHIICDLKEEKEMEKLEKEAVSQIREAIKNVEDAVEMYQVSVKKQNRRNLLAKPMNIFHCFKKIHEVRKKVQITNELIEENDNFIRYIKENDTSKSTSSTTKSSCKRGAREGRNEYDEIMVGLEDDSEMLMKQILEGSAELQVVSITGMCGIGKTTLAKKIYEDSRIKELFDCWAWIYASQEFIAQHLESEILSCLKPISEEDSGINEVRQLEESTLEYLKNKRFLLVIDNLCRTKLWDEIRQALPNDSNGSRILITTRNNKLALYASGGTLPYPMPFLNKEDSWKLFTWKVFRGNSTPPELEGPGREIVQRCGGLPISVAAVAALAASKEKNFETWSNLVHNLDSQLTHDETDMLDDLALSYNNLPWRLKLCFLYMAAFPKGFEIPVRQLIQLWMAEGFVKYTEKDGEDYLEELIDENLVQVSKRRADGGVKTCYVHDMLWLLCLSKSKNDKFLHVCTDMNIFSMTKPRRLSLHCSPSFYISSNPPHALSVRSLLCFTPDTHPFERRHWNWLQKSFKLIRVLNLGQLKIRAIPDSIGDLLVLKYLKVESEELKEIPVSIANILCLQTLDLRLSSVNVLPVQVWKVKELRHVYVRGPVHLPRFRRWKDHSYATNLQSLSMVALNKKVEKLFQRGSFLNLRKLGLRYKPCSNCNPSEVLASLGNLNHLRSLKVFGTSDLPRSSESFPRKLSKITLGEIEDLPSRTTRTLEALPELRILKLVGCKDSVAVKKFSFNCNPKGFPNLQVLQISGLNIKEWNLWESAMPHLQNLVIWDCEYLTVLPHRLWGLTSIKNIQVLTMAFSELAKNLSKLQVDDKSELLVNPLKESASSSYVQIQFSRASSELAENLNKLQARDKRKLQVDPQLESAPSSYVQFGRKIHKVAMRDGRVRSLKPESFLVASTSVS